jgi:predicted phage terminase large subunit-like protein
MVRELVAVDFESFVRKAFHTITGERLSADPYVGVLCKAVVDVQAGNIKRLVTNAPPRHAKSLVTTVGGTAWELAHNPTTKVMIVCYSEDLAEFMSNKVRDVMNSDWYMAAFPTRIREGRNRSMHFETTAGGQVFANHLGGGITGHGASLIIIDDPADIKAAEAPDRLAEVNGIFDRILRNRLNDPKWDRIVIVAHRIHPNDLSGHVLRQGGWTRVNLPFVAERDEVHLTLEGVWHRQAGELLRPDAFSDDEIAAVLGLTGTPDFRTLYQGTPEEPTWQLRPEHFPLFEVVPAGVGGIVISVDPAHVPRERNSYSVMQAWRSNGTMHFLLDQWRDKVAPRELADQLRVFMRRHPPSVVLIENASAGISMLPHLAERARGERFAVESISPGNRSKFARFADVVPMILAGRVHLPSKVFTPSLIGELTTFPIGGSDDQVDAMAQYLAWAIDHPFVPLRPARAMGLITTNNRRHIEADKVQRCFPGLRGRGRFFSRKR